MRDVRRYRRDVDLWLDVAPRCHLEERHARDQNCLGCGEHPQIWVHCECLDPLEDRACKADTQGRRETPDTPDRSDMEDEELGLVGADSPCFEDQRR